ncbi:hypothetical protein D9757_010794 [Collybiopsis confluens]|uniref:Protein kinase domain-containing protein n=1 Tax=Collybiopsis confluens TaxID=2823264 RepID=A0A8H5GTU0_9AGAR|nr:hypothetical protein D9757_010794 [Collybiopsis confluens]
MDRNLEDSGERGSPLKKLKIERKGKQEEQVDSQRSSTALSDLSNTSSEETDHVVITELLPRVRSTCMLVAEGIERVLCITKVILRSDGLTGRGIGTNVFEVECMEEVDVENAQRIITPEHSWKGKPLILKLSFPPVEQTKEIEFIDNARTYAKQHDGEWALRHLPLVVGYSTSLNWEGNHSDHSNVQNRLKSTFGDAYKMRSFATEFAQVFYDILQIHRWLYVHPKILHRDLSMTNVMFRREGDEVYGVLNDFDLSSFCERMDKDPTLKHGTGSKPYMAHDLLDADWDKGHFYRHDLESLFYIIPIISCHCTQPTVRASSLPFKWWFNRPDQEISDAKFRFLMIGSPRPLLQTYFNGFTPWVHHMHRIFSRGYKSRPGPYYPSDEYAAEVAMYDWDTLNRNVTYAKMMNVMGLFDEKELVTRWNGGNSSN